MFFSESMQIASGRAGAYSYNAQDETKLLI